MSNEIAITEDQLKAAYALNMCNVSVSQIVQYKDSYILEQEYDTILNNLNLEQIPKDEALLTILKELLNTISFFKIQDIKREQIERKYQQKVKNAIWSAVPSFGMIFSSGSVDPVSMGISLVTMIGTGLMNYRKAKAEAGTEKEEQETELRITALEQFDALQRELFTTAWRLADRYHFSDRYRLTEKQIRQYNAILMDADELRKFARLEAIQDKFEAYPQFWYYFAHTASYLSQSKDLGLDNESKAFYSQEAMRLFAKFMELNRFNILREDHIAATAALEYADIRLLNNAASDDVKQKVVQDLDACIGMAGNSNDLLQLFAIAYLRCGATDRAANVLKNLVNEDYNAVTNAKILSRLYAVQYLASDDDEGHRIHAQYQTLMLRVNPNCLFPLPTEKCSDEVLTQRYITAQKALLIREYRHAITAYAANRGKKYDILLRNMGQQGNIVVGSLNDTVASMDDLALFCKSKEKEKLLECIRTAIYNQRDDLKNARKVPFESLTKLFFEETIKQLTEEINALSTVRDLEQCYLGLVHFCQSVNIELPNSEHTGRYSNSQPIGSAEILYLDDRKLLSDQYKTDTQKLKRERIRNIIGLYKNLLIKFGSADAVLLMPGDKAFTAYFEERNAKQWEPETLMVLVDTTEKHCDLLLTYSGYILIERNRVGSLIPYEDVLSGKNDSNDYLELHWPDIYDNQGVDLRSLSNLLASLCKNS